MVHIKPSLFLYFSALFSISIFHPLSLYLFNQFIHTIVLLKGRHPSGDMIETQEGVHLCLVDAANAVARVR